MKKIIFSILLLGGFIINCNIAKAEETTSSTLETKNNSIVQLDNTAEPEIINEGQLNQATKKILDFFKGQQGEDGKIVDANISDWAVMAFAANNQLANQIKTPYGQSLFKYVLGYNFEEPSDLNVCATYPRHILALLAAGVDKNSSRPQELKDKLITTCYKDHNFGDNGINDDVFGLLSLLAVGQDPQSEVIGDLITSIESWQLENGAFSWPDWQDPSTKVAGDDITGAALNALIYAQSQGLSINNQIIENAKNYLKTSQLNNGVWGYYGSPDVLTTSWVLMGLNATGETQENWTVTSTGKNPWEYLYNNLNAEGYYTSPYAADLDWFATKHVVPALLNASWPIITEPQEEETQISNGSPYLRATITETELLVLTTSSTTSTVDTTATTTISFTTSTPETTTTFTLEISLPTLVTTTTLESTTSTINIDDTSTNDNLTTTPKLVKKNNKIEQTKLNTATTTANLTTTEPTNQETITTTTPVANPSKNIFKLSLTATIGLGLFLAWRLLPTLL